MFLLKTHAEEFVQEENVEIITPVAPWWIWIMYFPPIMVIDWSFLAVNLVLLWACANAMLHSFEDMISWDHEFLSPRFTGLILIPLASTAAEVPSPLQISIDNIASYIMACDSKE